MARIRKIDNVFSLGLMADKLSRYRPPGGAFDPSGSWRQAYGIYTLASGRARRIGVIQISKRVNADGTFSLSLIDRRRARGNTCHVLRGRIQCADGKPATPESWTWEVSTHTGSFTDPGKATLKGLKQSKSARVNGSNILIDHGPTKQTIKVDGPMTLNWALFDAVQRLPRRMDDPLSFTLIDHFDQVKPGYTLCYRGSVEAKLGDGPARLHGFDMLGRANVPWVFWTLPADGPAADNHDGGARLIAVNAGIEGYLLEAQST